MEQRPEPIAIIARILISHDREPTNRSASERAQQIIQALAVSGWKLTKMNL